MKLRATQTIDTVRARGLVIVAVILAAVAILGGAGPASAASDDEVPFYVVQPSVGGEPEFLFAIAQRFLGDGNRYEEIFELNEGRPQPDGSALTEPTSLNPGWILQLPADAEGEGVQFGPLPGADSSVKTPPAASEPAKTSSPTPPASPTSTPSADAEPRVDAEEPRSEDVASAQSADADMSGPPAALLIALAVVVVVLVAAGVFFWLRRRRSRPVANGERPRAAADRSASWTVDSALKIVVATCADEQIVFPGLYLVTVDATSIHLQLSSPSTKVPTGWTASPDGRTWTASLAYLQTQQVPAATNEQFSALATLGTTDEGRLLLDFRQAKGVVSVEGAAPAVNDVIDGWLTELTNSPWSGTPEVERLSSRGSAQQPSLDEFLAATDRAETGIAILEDSPTRAQSDALRNLYSSPAFGWIIIADGAFPGASWMFTVRDGQLSSNFLPPIRYSVAPALRDPSST